MFAEYQSWVAKRADRDKEVRAQSLSLWNALRAAIHAHVLAFNERFSAQQNAVARFAHCSSTKIQVVLSPEGNPSATKILEVSFIDDPPSVSVAQNPDHINENGLVGHLDFVPIEDSVLFGVEGKLLSLKQASRLLLEPFLFLLSQRQMHGQRNA